MVDQIDVNRILEVHISSPDKVIYQGNAEAVTTVNDKGVMDILPLHENFISLINTKVIVHTKIGGEKKEFSLNTGVLKVQRNKIHILTGFETLGEDATSQPAQPPNQPKP